MSSQELEENFQVEVIYNSTPIQVQNTIVEHLNTVGATYKEDFKEFEGSYGRATVYVKDQRLLTCLKTRLAAWSQVTVLAD